MNQYNRNLVTKSQRTPLMKEKRKIIENYKDERIDDFNQNLSSDP